MFKKFLCLLLALALPVLPALAAEEYPDGIYRGFYYDGGIEQLSIQFELQGGLFRSIVFRGVRYNDGDYLSRNASDTQKAILSQYRQLADHLIDKDVSAIDDLYTPYDFVEDADAVTTATMQSSKLISAIWDGLNRHPYKMIDTTKLREADPYADGVYRGQYTEGGTEEVGIDFTLQDNCFTEIRYTSLKYEGQDYLANEGPVGSQYSNLIAWLVGQPVSAVNSLYLPEKIVSDVDGYSSATLCSPKVISAIWDALGHHAYTLLDH